MNCPVCGERLRAIERYGVEIDICPACKGVWLDRGELDKILEYDKSGRIQETAQAAPAATPPREYPAYRDRSDDDRRDVYDRKHDDDDRHDKHERNHNDERRYGTQKRKGSWLGDILGGLGGDD